MIRVISSFWKCLQVKSRAKQFKKRWDESHWFKGQSIVIGLSLIGGAQYLRKEIYLKVKGVDKLETILSEEEFQKRDDCGIIEKYIRVYQDDLTTPLAIISPKRPERVQKVLKQLSKSNIGMLCTDSINDFMCKIDPDNDLKVKNHFVVMNPQNLKKIQIIEDEKIVKAGVGWKVHELNKILMKRGYYIPIDKFYSNQTLLDLINQDEGRLIHPVHKFFKQLVGDMLVFLPNGEAQIGTHTVGPGINMKELFFGSNANIGIPTEIDVKLTRVPANYLKLSINLDKHATWTQIYYIIKNLNQLKQHRYLSELIVTPNSKSIIITMDKTREVDDSHIVQKWRQRLIKGGFLEDSVINKISVERRFPEEYFCNEPQNEEYNFKSSFLVHSNDFIKHSLQFITYLQEQQHHFSNFQAEFDLSSKVINLSLNYNENSEDLLRHNEFIQSQSLQPTYHSAVQQEDHPLQTLFLKKIPMFRYLADYFLKSEEEQMTYRSQLFRNLIPRKSHPREASPLIQEDPRKSFVKKLINHAISQNGQLIFCNNIGIKNFFKEQDLFLNYGLHGSRLQLDLYKFFDRANILYNPIHHQKQVYANKITSFPS